MDDLTIIDKQIAGLLRDFPQQRINRSLHSRQPDDAVQHIASVRSCTACQEENEEWQMENEAFH